MDIQERIAKRKDRIEKVSNLLKEDPMLVETILDEIALRRATTIEELRDYLTLLEFACRKDQHILNEFNRCWDALSLKEVQSAESISEVQTALSRASEKSESEVRRLAIFKMLVFLEHEEKQGAR